MKKLYFIILVMFAQNIFAQTYDLDLDANVMRNYGNFKKGNTVRLKSLTHTLEQDNLSLDKPIVDVYTLETSVGNVNVKEKLEKVFDVKFQNAQQFWDAQILFNILEDLSKNGTQEDLRAKMEEDALKFVNDVQKSRLEFHDPFLESYIYSIITKISPGVFIDNRPGSINLLIIRSSVVNAFMFPNGTLCITTGLISLMHTEDEMAAILAHEIAHFVLDHQIQNYNAMIKRQKRAAAWTSFATVLAGVAEAAIAYNNPDYFQYYKPGLPTLTVALASINIAASISEHLGMKYTREQEKEADEMATKLMGVVGYSPNAFASALARVQHSMKMERSINMYFASDHPALVERIQKAGTPSESVDANFEKIISFAVSDAAYWKMQDRRFRQALPLYNQNIKNRVATDEDYIQKTNCILYLKNDEKSYSETITYIEEAKRINPNNINVYKTEVVAYLRQKNYDQAKVLLKQYKERLIGMYPKDKDMPETQWSSLYSFLNAEIKWSEEMIHKVSNL